MFTKEQHASSKSYPLQHGWEDVFRVYRFLTNVDLSNTRTFQINVKLLYYEKVKRNYYIVYTRLPYNINIHSTSLNDTKTDINSETAHAYIIYLVSGKLELLLQGIVIDFYYNL